LPPNVKAGKATGEFEVVEERKLTVKVPDLAHELRLSPIPDVEGIQDIAERVLFDTAFFKSAKAYILYREKHAQIRAIAAKASVDLVDSYPKELDWKICEKQQHVLFPAGT
jgi:ribonucleoside-triphosphate reductase